VLAEDLDDCLSKARLMRHENERPKKKSFFKPGNTEHVCVECFHVRLLLFSAPKRCPFYTASAETKRYVIDTFLTK
jgi:hypothetical protein